MKTDERRSEEVRKVGGGGLGELRKEEEERKLKRRG